MVLGYVLGENKWVQNNLELVILGIVVLATAPVILKAMTGNKDENIAINIEKKQES